MAKKNERFRVVFKEGSMISESTGIRSVLVDTETGVNYLWIKSGYAGGLTPLLDAEGKPVITEI
ncbi:MAG: hypothetical protein IJV39_03425 [Ruminococcus sp.]|nr:hypothetical protein [Ruminococcus sp.]